MESWPMDREQGACVILISEYLFDSPCQRPWRKSVDIVKTVPNGLVVKNLPANEGDTGDADSIPRLGRSLGGENGNPLQYSCLENPMERGAWWAVVFGVTKSWTWLEPLSVDMSTSEARRCWTHLLAGEPIFWEILDHRRFCNERRHNLLKFTKCVSWHAMIQTQAVLLRTHPVNFYIIQSHIMFLINV